MSGMKKNDNMPSNTQARGGESHTLSGFEHIPRYLGEEQDTAVESGGEIGDAENSNTKEQNHQRSEDEHKEISNHPRRRSSLAEAIRARPDILQRQEAQNTSVPSPDRGLYNDPVYLSTNPNNPRPGFEKEGEFGMRMDNYRKRDQTHNPNLDDGGRNTSERSETDNESFTPTVRRRKALYHQEQQKSAGLGVSRAQKQKSQDVEVIVPESSAQGAKRELASASRKSNTSNHDGENTTQLVTGFGEGTTIEEKSSNPNNPSVGGPSSEPSCDFSRDSERDQFGPSSNSSQQIVARPLATPRQQHQRTSSSITVDDRSSDIMLPRWQPDSEVDECPICHKTFNFFSRKHHCRKCGRVVCNACSPHRITIPYQYIVQPPVGFDDIAHDHARTRSRTISQNSVHDPEVGGGMKVRLCNPCVPDPNTSPPAPNITLDRPLPPLPQLSSPPPQAPARTSSNRERVRRSELCPVCGDRLPPSTTAIENHIDRCISRHLREADFSTPTPRPQVPSYSEQIPGSSSLPSSSNTFSHPTRPRHTSEATTLGTFSAILNHFHEPDRNPSASPPIPEAVPSRPFLSSRMISFAATQLDTVGEDSECIICMEDFEEGVEMARLECLCKYHKKCIDGWFFKHPGRCPVHGQDPY